MRSTWFAYICMTRVRPSGERSTRAGLPAGNSSLETRRICIGAWSNGDWSFYDAEKPGGNSILAAR